ncbi:hypothetical protein DdX_11696 [Ditylenchus destructor]|uniref:Uncharacterized protein n=1 Tax=Ditylenchus destructor TaxID=166010 RepID=A0AAD4MZJ8_9BILA|nr:hypothetical protein DdX_11696 [Ditylenchus destructor]
MEIDQYGVGPGDSGSGVIVERGGQYPDVLYGITKGGKTIDSTRRDRLTFVRESNIIDVRFFLKDFCDLLGYCTEGTSNAGFQSKIISYQLNDNNQFVDGTAVPRSIIRLPQRRKSAENPRRLTDDENEKIQGTCKSKDYLTRLTSTITFTAALVKMGTFPPKKYYSVCNAVIISPWQLITVQNCLDENPDLLIGGKCLNVRFFIISEFFTSE